CRDLRSSRARRAGGGATCSARCSRGSATRHHDGVKTLRTPDDRFLGLPDFPWPASYVDVDTGDGTGTLRMAYVEAGPADGPVVLCLHGEPTWSFLYRKVMRVLADAGCRAVALDLVGFGRSDKPAEVGDYTYARQVEWTRQAVFDRLGLRDV